MAKNSRQLWTDKLSGNGNNVDFSQISKCKSFGTNSICVRKNFSGIILGIDPSLRGTGIAVVDFTDKNNPKLLFSERIDVSRKYDFIESIVMISRKCSEILQNFPEINCAVLEQTIFVQNYQIAQILGAVRGAIISVVGSSGIKIYEYAPLRIKQAVVGAGRASKEQINKTIKALLDLKVNISNDESDAAAAALCHAWTFKE